MKPQNFFRTVAISGIFFTTLPGSTGQGCDTPPAPPPTPPPATPPSVPPAAMPAAQTDSAAPKTGPAAVPPVARPGFLQNWEFNGGQLTLPFKIRKKEEKNTFRLTTDVTIGGYIGASKVISEKHNYRLLVPVSAGLTFINLDNSASALDLETPVADVVPGITWCTGLILQLGDCNVGLVVGKDYASEVGDDWQYNGKFWWSFAIGYAFIGGKED
ncbi:MAG: hypothetical protein IT259_15070 [Saprospiraceae bacterium]|nr:hypothetical protein [Saprospiraceae bacterium]